VRDQVSHHVLCYQLYLIRFLVELESLQG
jgi:hypothetical protein